MKRWLRKVALKYFTPSDRSVDYLLYTGMWIQAKHPTNIDWIESQASKSWEQMSDQEQKWLRRLKKVIIDFPDNLKDFN